MRQNRSEALLFIAVFTALITALWFYTNIVKALNKPDHPVLTAEETQKLNPKLDGTVFEELKARKD